MNGKYKGTRDRDRKQARPRSRRYEFAPARGRAKHRRRVRIVWRRFLPVMGCAFLLIFGSVKLFGYLASSRQVKETEAELQALYEAQKAEPTVTTPTPASTTAPVTSTPSAQPSSGTGGTQGGGVSVPSPESGGNLVWIPTNGGTRYHSHSGCSGMIDPIQVSVETALANGFTRCGRCW